MKLRHTPRRLEEEVTCIDPIVRAQKKVKSNDFLLESARKVGLEGAAEYLDDPNNGLQEINGKHQLSGGQPAEVFIRAFQVAAK
ncbi:hypothetical protein Tco_0844682 [Tanacetum coccineum]